MKGRTEKLKIERREVVTNERAKRKIKGIFKPFELGGVTRLIPSAVKFCKAIH
jgi:hypothetical protein